MIKFESPFSSFKGVCFFGIFDPALDLSAQSWLIILDIKNIMSFFFTDYPAGIFLAVKSIGCNDTALQIHLLKELLRYWYFIGLFRYGYSFQIKVHTSIVYIQCTDIAAGILCIFAPSAPVKSLPIYIYKIIRFVFRVFRSLIQLIQIFLESLNNSTAYVCRIQN